VLGRLALLKRLNAGSRRISSAIFAALNVRPWQCWRSRPCAHIFLIVLRSFRGLARKKAEDRGDVARISCRRTVGLVLRCRLRSGYCDSCQMFCWNFAGSSHWQGFWQSRHDLLRASLRRRVGIPSTSGRRGRGDRVAQPSICDVLCTCYLV